MNSRLLRCLAAVLAVTAAPLIEAQTYDVSAGNFNWIYVPYAAPLSPGTAGAAATPYGPPNGSNQANLLPTANSNFQGVGQVAGSSSAMKVDSLPTYTYAATYPAATYPANGSSGETVIVLENSYFGGTFASGVPRYLMGDVMVPPLVKVDGVTPAPAGYWRTKPVEPGESITLSVNVKTSSTSTATVTVDSVPQGVGIGSVLLGRQITAITGTTLTLAGNASNTYTTSTAVAVIAVPIAVYTVNVTACGTDKKQVTVASITPGVVVGATLLGEPITAISGLNITLAGTANQTITSSTAVTVTPAMSYYYSPHAEKVYASQPGRVQITWVTLAATAGTTYGLTSETFSVSSNSAAKVRTIYWTEGSFDGPKVPVTDGRITTVSPVFNSSVPKAVAQEVDIPGFVPTAENLTTLSFDKYSGNGMIHAYNVEGRILIEYLGNVRLGNNVYQSHGIDVVDMVRAPSVNYSTVHLGQTLAPHDGDTSLTASPLISTQVGAASYYGNTAKADGTAEYTAERETSGPNSPDNGSPASPDAYNKVVFYWLEEGTFGIQWPKYQDRYWLRWSPNLADYAHYTVDSAGSTADNGLQFTNGLLPQIVYQDDGNQVEAKIDDTSQRLYVKFGVGSDLRNRSLLKFTNTGATWYVNLYTQAETRSLALASTSVTTNGVTTMTVSSTTGLEVGMNVTGPGISGTATIVSITDNTRYVLSTAIANATNPLKYTVEEDGSAPINGTATVGTRLAAPSGHEIAGYISGGTGYYPAGYLDPSVVGAAAANAGAIIPVNAMPGNDVLTVRWFKKIAAPSANFKDLYIPGKVGRYTVSYPAEPSQIVIAQGVGTNDLSG